MGIRQDVDAVEEVDAPAMPARIAGQPRVPAGLPVARDDGVARLEAGRGVGLALLGHALAHHVHHSGEQLGILAVGEGLGRVRLEVLGPRLELLALDHALLHEQRLHRGQPVLVVARVEVALLPHALDGMAELVDVVDALDHADEVHHEHGLFPVRVEGGLVCLALDGTEAVLAAEVVDAVHGWADDPAGPQSCQAD
jgi:hypothetical protein